MKGLFLFFTLILFACGASKNTENNSNLGKTSGVVVISNDCTYIKATVDGKTVTMYPVNLEKKYKIADTMLNFDFAMSRGAQPTNCQVDKVVSVSNLSIAK